MQDTVCEKCGEAIRFSEDIDMVKCRNCGGIYKIADNSIDGQSVERTYDFIEFQCVHTTYSEKCSNGCPAPEMYCEEHTSDESFVSAEQTISYVKERLQTAEDTLEQMKESKKTWLIQEVSGINEQDSSIRED